MRTAIALALTFSSLALAYQVLTPNESQGWTNAGAQPLTWQRVDTDPLNFTAVLTNEDRTVLPTNNQVLAALVDGTKGSTSLNPPSAGWPVGSGFRVNLVQDASNLNAILAQSPNFTIQAAKGSSTTSGSGSTLTVASPTSTDGSTATSSTNTSPTPNAALPTFDAQIGLMSALAFLGVFFA